MQYAQFSPRYRGISFTLLVLAFLVAAGCASTPRCPKHAKRDVCIVNWHRVNSFLKERDRKPYGYEIRRNSTGTKLYIHMESSIHMSQDDCRQEVWVVSANGNVERKVFEGCRVFLNDEGDCAVSFRKGHIQVGDAQITSNSNEGICVDWSAKYFVTFGTEVTRVYSVDTPHEPLLSTDMGGADVARSKRLFVSGESLYLFAEYYAPDSKRPGWKDGFLGEEYAITESGLVFKRRFRIPGPEGISPAPISIHDVHWSDGRALIVPHHDFHWFPERLYITQLKTLESGRAGSPWHLPLFLSPDPDDESPFAGLVKGY